MALVVDTGPLVAMLDANDPDHTACARLLTQIREDRVVPAPVLVELEYLLRPVAGAFAQMLTQAQSGALVVRDLSPGELQRAGQIVDTYASASVGFVDAAVLATVEALGETRVATLDRRHFSILRPRHTDALQLLPG